MTASQHLNKRLLASWRKCPSQAWRKARLPRSPLSVGEQQRIDEGNLVGRLARSLFPKGILVDERGFDAAVRKTAQLMADPAVGAIFEAAFIFEGCATRADIIARGSKGGWHLYEVKSSLSSNPLSTRDLDDMAYTAAVIMSANTVIESTSLVRIDPEYRSGMTDERLFSKHECTLPVAERALELKNRLVEAWRDVAQRESPAPSLTLACKGCNHFKQGCIGDDLAHPVFELPRLSASAFQRMKAQGFLDISALPARYSLTPTQFRIAQAVRQGGPSVDRPWLARFLQQIKYPAAYLDFETTNSALPVFQSSAPHQRIVTQFSLHLLDSLRGSPCHFDYLAEHDRDRQRELVERLLDVLPGTGSILTYSAFEQQIIRELSRRLPEYAAPLEKILPRIVDLAQAFEIGYYDPRFNGSTSIKAVLPVMVPDLQYEGLVIPDGETASAIYLRMVRGNIAPEEIDRMRHELREYCKLDTLALLTLHRRLTEIARGG